MSTLCITLTVLLALAAGALIYAATAYLEAVNRSYREEAE